MDGVVDGEAADFCGLVFGIVASADEDGVDGDDDSGVGGRGAVRSMLSADCSGICPVANSTRPRARSSLGGSVLSTAESERMYEMIAPISASLKLW